MFVIVLGFKEFYDSTLSTYLIFVNRSQGLGMAGRRK